MRAPFGCEVIFKQAPTKAKEFQPVKFEGTGSTGILAGYRFQPGYKWHGVYLVWSLDELLAVDLSAGAKSFPESIRHPHVTEVCDVACQWGNPLPYEG